MSYNAFISYRHTEPDMYVAKQVHKRLETFKVPRNVAKKTGMKKIQRVFRDQEELPIGSDLGDNITKALEESEYLIVICSPQTPQSYWVQTEIETFIKLHGRERILAVLVEGEPSEAFPKQLLTDDEGRPVEPLAADVRGKTRSEITRRLRSEIVRLAAPILGCSYDELKQRHRERRMRKVICAIAVIAMLAIAFGVYSVYNYLAIQRNYQGKLINQSKYLADTSLSLLEEGDRITAGLIALEALPSDGDDRPLVTSAQFALSQTLYAYENGSELVKDRLLKHELPVESILYCQEGAKLVTIDRSGKVYVWNTDDGTLITQIPPRIEEYGYVLGAMVTQDDTIVIITPFEVRGLDINGDDLWSVTSEAIYTGCVIDAEMEIIAGISEDTIDFINADSGTIEQSINNPSDSSIYSNDAVFNAEGNIFAVAHYAPEEQEYAEISIYNLDTEEYIIAETECGYIMELDFAPDDNVVAITREHERILDYLDEDFIIYVEKLSSSDGKGIWVKELQTEAVDITSFSLDLKSRNYIDKMTETEHSEIMLTIYNRVYTFDSQSGEQVSEINVSSEIASLLISTTSGLGYIVEDDGIINCYNLTAGTLYVSGVVEIDRDVTEVCIKDGVLAGIIYSSPDVILMKYHEGYGMEKVMEHNMVVYGMDYSADESFYVIYAEEAYEGLDELSYYFYSTKDNELVAKWSNAEAYYGVPTCFISNSIYAVMTDSGKVFLYDVANDTTKCIEPSMDIVGVRWFISDNKQFALAYDYDKYYLVDFKEQKITAEGSTSNLINCGVISDDGRQFYGSGNELAGNINNKVFCMDTESGAVTYIDDAYNVAHTGDISMRRILALSPDGKYLAVSCADNILRIWDTQNNKIIAEIPYAGQNNSFLQFMPDSNNLIMQGDTFYLKVYDLDSEKFVFISDEQYNYIEEMVVDDTTNTVALSTTIEMLILNGDDFEPLAYVKNGLAYMPENGYVFNKSIEAVHRFPYMDLNMLIEEAGRQFKGHELTEWERIQYNID